MGKIKTALKRDGREVPFDPGKIADAIYKAAQAAGGESRFVAEELAEAVTLVLEKEHDGTPPHIERIQDLVERVLMETGHTETAKAYILYRERRARIRNSLRVRKSAAPANPSDLRVSPGARDEITSWDREKIVLALEIEASLDAAAARDIAAAVEQKVLASGMTQVSTSLIRELVDNELFTRGLSTTLEKQALIGLPRFDVDQILFARTKTSHKVVASNPEAINLTIAEHVLRQYALSEVFSRDVAEAHMAGRIHIHDLGYPTRIYIASHSLEFLKTYGLTLDTIDVSSAPARYASTLTSQLSTFLGAMQSYAAGPQGIDFLNILYAPYIEGLAEAEVRQEAQRLIFEGAQHAFSRGGQTLFVDFNIYPDVPPFLRDVPAIGPGGQPTGRTYASYRSAAQTFARHLLEVWKEGDQFGGLFCFPKCDFHVMPECFGDPAVRSLLDLASQAAAHNGAPVFVLDRAGPPRLGPPLRRPVPDRSRPGFLQGLRSVALQSVTINLPQAAYRAGGRNLPSTITEVEQAIRTAIRAHVEKRKFIGRLSASHQLPLWQLRRTVRDGQPYANLEDATVTIGLIGLSECLACAMGEELHTDPAAVQAGLALVETMARTAERLGLESGLRVRLEETPSENAARRLALIDARSFSLAASVLRGDPGADEAYYTNGAKLRTDAPVPFSRRLQIESRFHPAIEVHPLIQAYLAEPGPSPPEITAVLQRAFQETEAAQIAFTPRFTQCLDCRTMTRGVGSRCAACDSVNVTGLTRIADYFSRTTEWNRSKRAELQHRRLLQRLD